MNISATITHVFELVAEEECFGIALADEEISIEHCMGLEIPDLLDVRSHSRMLCIFVVNVVGSSSKRISAGASSTFLLGDAAGFVRFEQRRSRSCM